MTPRKPQDRRRRGAVAEPPRYPSGPELSARLAALRWWSPPPARSMRRSRRKGKR